MRLWCSTVLIFVVRSHPSPDLSTDEANPNVIRISLILQPVNCIISTRFLMGTPANIIVYDIDYELPTIGGPVALGDDDEECSLQETPSNPLRNRKLKKTCGLFR
jgi:hypothetical protein